MSGRMDWRRARLSGRRTLDHRYEFDPDYPDRAARWLQKAERQQYERRSIAPNRKTKIGNISNSTRVPYTDDAPW
jgi:hypothetical protein